MGSITGLESRLPYPEGERLAQSVPNLNQRDFFFLLILSPAYDLSSAGSHSMDHLLTVPKPQGAGRLVPVRQLVAVTLFTPCPGT